jgi:hypothetical protein
MKRAIRLTERDLNRIVRKVINEQDNAPTSNEQLIARLRSVLDDMEKSNKGSNDICIAVRSVCKNFEEGKDVGDVKKFKNENPFNI